LLVVLYWLRKLREERRLSVLGNRVLRGIFVAKGDEVTGNEEYIISNFMIRSVQQILFL